MKGRLSTRVDALLRSRLLGLLACALSFALVMLRIDAKSIWWDESLSLMRAQSDVSTILSGRISFGGLDTIDQHPPLYFLALSAVSALAGESDLSLRLLSALATVGVVAVTFALARRLFGGRVAGMGAVFTALSPLLVWYGQEMRMYALATLLCSVVLYAAWRANTEGSWPWAAGAVVALAAAAATQYLTLLFALCAVAIAGWAHHWHARRAHHRRIAASVGGPWRSGAIAVLIFLVALSVAYALLRRLPPSGAYAEPPLSLGNMLVDLLNSYSLGLSVSLRDVWWIDAVFGLVWLTGIGALMWPMLRRHPSGSSVSRISRVALLVAAPLVPVIVVWLLTRRIAFYRNSRYVMFAAPLFSLALAWALTRHRWAPARWLLALGLLVAMGWSLQRYYFDPHYATKEEYAGAVDYVTARELSGDLLIVHGPESQAAVEHYYRGRLPLVGLPQMGTLGQLDEVLTQTTAGYDRVWVIHARCGFTDPDEQLSQWFEEHTYPEMTTTFDSHAALVSVSLYNMADPFQASATPGESLATAGPARLIRAGGLTGEEQVPLTTLGKEAAALAVASGESVGARLTWVLDAPTPDLKLSLRLVREGLVWAQRDLRPSEQHHSDGWPSDASVTHTASLPVPRGLPPATYTLQLWVYDGQTGESWPIVLTDGTTRDHLALAQVIVGPPDRVRARWRAPWAAAWAPRWGALGRAVVLDEVAGLPTTVSPGQEMAVSLTWRWQGIAPRNLDVALTWQSADGRTLTANTLPLLGPGAVSPAVATMEGVWTLAPIAAPAEPGAYSLHLIVHDRTARRYLALRRGPLPSLSRDLRLGRVTVGP